MSHGPIEAMADEIIDCISAGGRPLITGTFGVGKTYLIHSIAKRTGRRMKVLIGSMADPTDVNGFPVVNHDVRVTDADGRSHPVVEQAPPRIFTDMNDGNKWILFLDELTSVPATVQAPWLNLIHGGMAGQYRLNQKNVAIICAANRADEAVNGQELAGPMLNRLDHFDFPVNEQAALEWADNIVGYWGDPELGWPVDERPAGVEDVHIIKAGTLLSGFVRRNPSVWHPAIGGGGEKSRFALSDLEYACPTARSLDRCRRYIALMLARGLPAQSATAKFRAAAGTAAATEFNQYAVTNDLPDPEDVLSDPEGWTFSGRVDIDYQVMLAVAAAVASKPSVDRLIGAFQICERSVSNRAGSPSKEAAMAAVIRLGKLTVPDSETYKKMTKGMSSAALADFASRMQRVVGPFTKKYVPMIRGAKA